MSGASNFATPPARKVSVIVAWVARVTLAGTFAVSGLLKLAGHAHAVGDFERLSLSQGLRVLVGACEVAGAIGLLIPPAAAVAALGLAGLMVGAAWVLFAHGRNPLPALVVLGLCLFVAWAERATLRIFVLLQSGKGPMDGWVARAYDRGVQAEFSEMFPTLTTEVLPELSTARRILDVGCGPGQFTVFVAEAIPGAEVWGIDLAPTMIELARAHAAASPAASRLRFQVANVGRLPFPDSSFDAVLSTGSIKHWHDPIAGLREIHRVLALGGRAVIAEMNRLASREAIATQRQRLRHWFFRWTYSRIFSRSLSPTEGRALVAASPFGGVARERMLLEGCVWLLEARKAGAAPPPNPGPVTPG